MKEKKGGVYRRHSITVIETHSYYIIHTHTHTRLQRLVAKEKHTRITISLLLLLLLLLLLCISLSDRRFCLFNWIIFVAIQFPPPIWKFCLIFPNFGLSSKKKWFSLMDEMGNLKHTHTDEVCWVMQGGRIKDFSYFKLSFFCFDFHWNSTIVTEPDVVDFGEGFVCLFSVSHWNRKEDETKKQKIKHGSLVCSLPPTTLLLYNVFTFFGLYFLQWLANNSVNTPPTP